MIALDLSPLVWAPGRGVARALLHLLAGLDRIAHDPLFLRGYLPRVQEGALRLGVKPSLVERAHVVGPEDPSPRVWRKALAPILRADGARVLLSPWAAFPRTQVPVVAWIHEAPFARHGALEGHLRTMRHRRALERAMRRAAALVVPSEAVRRDVLSLGSGTDVRVEMVPHGFIPRTVKSVADVDVPVEGGGPPGRSLVASGAVWYVDARPTSRPPPPKPYALMVGTGRGAAGPWKKGVDVLLDAFLDARLADLKLAFVGQPVVWAQTRYVYPEPDDFEVGELLAGARVVVVPSRSEGFGYPVLEGFAAGVPVVASAAGALPEVSGGAARLVPPGDVDALAEAILRVHSDEDLRARLIKAGHRRALEFPVEGMARGWLRVLTQAGGIPWHN